MSGSGIVNLGSYVATRRSDGSPHDRGLTYHPCGIAPTLKAAMGGRQQHSDNTARQ